MKRIRLFEWSGGRDFFHQWGRLKRREKNLYLLIYTIWFLHAIFWLLWSVFIAPYPIALTLPINFGLGDLVFLKDFLWPMANFILLAVNTWLVFYIYPKDILAAWLLLGASLFIQIVVLGITLSLIAVAF
ncbi:hypothetical protein KKE14_00240 [Patescibacteria group bacterium]|nr:hypothetical protein [Patescibacteria group bacterium]